MTRRQPKATRRIFHVPKGIAYGIENSLWAVALAYALGFRWIDIDGWLSRDGVPMAMHWERVRRNGYELPDWFIAKYGDDPYVSHCLAADLCTLRTKRVWYRGKFRRTYCRTLLQVCYAVAQHKGMGVMYEEKNDPAFDSEKAQKAVLQARYMGGLDNDRFIVGTLSNLRGAGRRMKAAHGIGHVTMLIARGPWPTSWEPYVDYVRGTWTRTAA